MYALGAFLDLLAFAYYACFILLAVQLLFIAICAGKRGRAVYSLRRVFLGLGACLLCWQVTLFLEPRCAAPVLQLWLSRANFAAMAMAAFLTVRFVVLIPSRPSDRARPAPRWLVLGTCIMTLASLLTPLVDQSESVQGMVAVSAYGWLFPAYLAHVTSCLIAAVVLAIRKRHRSTKPAARAQLRVLAFGIAGTGGVALVTNAVLPYAYGDFRFCDAGPVSTLAFALAVAYATFAHGLFDPKVVLRRTLVYGVMMALVLGAYSSAVFVVSQNLTGTSGNLVQFAVLLIAFSFDPVRRYLEEKTDALLFAGRRGRRAGASRRGRKSLTETGGTIGLLMPWRRR